MPARNDKSELIRIALAGGAKPADVARDLGVSLRRVYQVRGVEKPKPRIDEAMRTRIEQQLAAGVSQRLVAEQTGVSRKTVQMIASKMDKPAVPRHDVLAGETVAYILQRARAGRDTGTIASETGLSKSTIRSVIRRNAGGLRPDDDIMRAIVDELRLRGMSVSDLCAIMPPPPTVQLVHDYVAGRRSPGSVNASRMLRALGLRLVRADGLPA